MKRQRTHSRRTDLRLSIEQLEQRVMLASTPYSIVLLPDTQTLAESSPATLNAQTQWVADHVVSNNIVFLSQVGDLVDDPEDDLQWQNIDTAISILDGNPINDPDGLLPYSAAIGNHDYDDDNTHQGASKYTQYFGASRYDGKSWYGGSSFDELNHFQIFTADNRQFLHLTIEWEARDAAITWAQGILDAYADLPTILTTHAYVNSSGVHSTQQLTTDGRSGEDVFQDLVSPNPQIFMVLGGHFGGEAHQVSLNSAGDEVIEILANFQERPAGADGFLQLIEFDPDLDLVNVSTYSPALDAFETDANSQFSLSLDFDQRFSLASAPRARLTQPSDNGILDLDTANHSVLVNTVQSSLEISLLDFSSGLDDATVTSATVSLTKDGVPQTESTDYTFAYDSTLDQVTLSPVASTFDDGTYEISLNFGAAKIADNDTNELVPVTLSVEVDTTIPNPPESLYFALNSMATLPGGITVEDEDIAFFDGLSFSAYFDGSDVGLSGLEIDAFDIASENELLFSFASSGTVPGIAETVDDSDIVKFTATELGSTTSGTFELYFDGSDVSLTTSGEDINSLDLLADGRILVSTRGTFDVGAITGADEDIFLFTPTSLGSTTAGAWELHFDGSDVSLEGEDIDALSVYQNGDIYLSAVDAFDLADSNIRDDDVFVFSPTTLGNNTTGNYASNLLLDGSLYGLSPFDVVAVHIPSASAGNTTLQAQDDSLFLSEGGTAGQLVGGAFSLLDNDLPSGSLMVTTTPITAPSFGTLTLNADGTFGYTHDGSENFTDSFVYEVQDAGGLSDTALVSINIDPVNDPPSLAGLPDVSLIENGTDNSIDLDAFYSDVETPATAAVFTILSSFSGISAAIDPVSHVLTIAADPGFTGEGDLTIQVTDSGDGGSSSLNSSDTLHVTVVPGQDSVLLLGVNQTSTVGNITADNEDVLIFNGIGFEVLFDGSDVGIEAARVDGFTLLSPSELLLSFSLGVTIPGIAGTVEDMDIVKFTGTHFGETTQGTFELFFDGSDVGLDGSSSDIDAIDVLPDGRVLVSIAGSDTILGLSVRDDDLIAFTSTSLGDNTAGTWELYFDGSDVGLSPEDVTGVSVDAGGNIYLAVQSDFVAGSVSGEDEDVFVFDPTSLGPTTSGTFTSPLYFDGSQFGIVDAELVGLQIAPTSLLPSMGVPSADFVDDDVIDGLDFLAWQIGFGISSGALQSDGDSDGDGDVDTSDLAVWESTYGQTELLPLAGSSANDSRTAVATPNAMIDAAMALNWDRDTVDERTSIMSEQSTVESSFVQTFMPRQAALMDRAGENLDLQSSTTSESETAEQAGLVDELLERAFS